LLSARLEPTGLVSNIKQEVSMAHKLKHVVPLIRRCTRCQLGWLLAAIHTFWLDLGIRSLGPPSRAAANFLNSVQGADWTLFAGRPFHFTHQSWILKSVMLADLPAIVVASVGTLLLWPISFIRHVGRYQGSYIGAGLLFVVATGQWLMVGCVIQKQFRSKRQTT
jgi:hypothetical protein